MNKIYFNGLNELRAVAALGVIIHHIEQIKGMHGFGIANENLLFLVHNLGKSGVNLFFVLSGFLITYLLLQEKASNKQRIDIVKFYLRRVFRIWPLYYFIMAVSFVAIPLLSRFSIFQYNMSLLDSIQNSANYNLETVLLYLLFLPQFANDVVGASQSWSVGLEEQFYLLVPLALTVFRKKLFFMLTIVASIVYFSITIGIVTNDSTVSLVSHAVTFLEYFNFQFLLIGVMCGYLYFYNQKTISVATKNKLGYIAVLAILFFLSLFEIMENKLNHFTLGILFGCLILFTINESNPIVFRNRALSYLGKISYGIYMYHVFILFLIFPFANKYFSANGTSYNLFTYGAGFLLTILISGLSYRFLESRFIKIKDTRYKVK